MFFKTLRDLARPQIVAIFDVLKRSDGLAVGDLADALKMSYMGVKQYCIELEKRGYLDTWRRAKETGRPELTYRLTPKAQCLFPQHSNELSLEILDAVRQLHGPTAAEKILYQYFLKKADAYAKKIKGKSLIERATSLARLRDAEGHCAQVDYDPRHGLRLTEYHSPLAELIKLYPSVAKMEEAMLSRLLLAPVQRDMSTVSGLMRITFLVAGATLPPPAPPKPAVRARSTTKTKEIPNSPTVGSEPGPDELSVLADTPLADTPLADTPLADTPTASEDPALASGPDEAAATAESHDLSPAADVVSSSDECAAPVETPLVPPVLADAPEALDDQVTTQVEAAPTETTEPATAGEGRELLLFAPPVAAPPRLPARANIPARPSAKSTEPVAEELFLSL
jgi:predicted ArsR family transcriptional regulator